MTRALIIGADGAIGLALERYLLARGDEVIGTSRRDPPPDDRIHLDLADPGIADTHPPDCDVAIVCAAMARFADCRDKPELARAINVTGPEAIGRKVVSNGGRILYLSSSVALACDRPHAPADQPRDPRSAYGRFKAEGEEAILALGPGASVFRLTKVMVPDMELFNGWIDSLSRGQAVKAFLDQTFSPLRMSDVVAGLAAAIDDAGSGIYQISGAGDPSYADVARHFARRLGQPDDLVESALAVDNGIDPSDVTRFTSLDTSRITALTGWRPPDPFAVLDEVFAEALNRPTHAETCAG